MKKDYEAIKKCHQTKIAEQREKEKQAVRKFKKVDTTGFTNYIIIYKDYLEMYAIDGYEEIGDIDTSKNINKINYKMLVRLKYKEF